MAAGNSSTTNQQTGKDTFVVFVHGFMGERVATWGGFEELLNSDADLKNCQYRFWDYPTDVVKNNNLNPVHLLKALFWEDDPNIETISQGLRTLLSAEAEGYANIVLFGHSMGGLVIQKFILEELWKNRTGILNRIAEVAFFGTPSGGLRTAALGALIKGQIANMSAFGAFIGDLRSDWKRLIDDRRSDPEPPVKFHLTLFAGWSDEFVPQEASLNPFPFNDKEILPGNHTSMIKPQANSELVYQWVKKLLTRATHRQQIAQQSKEAIQLINRIRTATDLGISDELIAVADKLSEATQPRFPLVERELGLALLGEEEYQRAADIMDRYLEFQSSAGAPLDVQVVQQSAIALSGAGKIVDAVARLKQLSDQFPGDTETQGIMAGRYKRQWLKREHVPAIGWQAFDLYQTAFAAARTAENEDQAIYNGINAAYLNFALGGKDPEYLAKQVLQICQDKKTPDYWSEATRAEAHLLLRQYAEAESAYKEAQKKPHQQRHWTTTGQQACDIVKRQSSPPEAAAIVTLFSDIK